MATQTSRQNKNSLLSGGSAIWFSAGWLRVGAEVHMETRMSKYLGRKLAGEFPLLLLSRKPLWSELSVKALARLKDFLNHPLSLAICLFVLRMDITAHKGKHSYLICLSPQVIPRVYPNKFSFKSITWIAHYLFRQKKLANYLTSHFTDILPHISPLILSCFTSFSLSFDFCLLCHVEESIRNWWMVTDLQACLPALASGWRWHDAAFLQHVCASCIP